MLSKGVVPSLLVPRGAMHRPAYPASRTPRFSVANPKVNKENQLQLSMNYWYVYKNTCICT